MYKVVQYLHIFERYIFASLFKLVLKTTTIKCLEKWQSNPPCFGLAGKLQLDNVRWNNSQTIQVLNNSCYDKKGARYNCSKTGFILVAVGYDRLLPYKVYKEPEVCG